jgi:hypothetical protein
MSLHGVYSGPLTTRVHAKREQFIKHRRELGLLIDEAAKTIALANGTPFTVQRFDGRWIALPAAMCSMNSIVKIIL